MPSPPADKFRTLLSREDWDQLVALLPRLDPSVAADLFMEIPLEQREMLFRRLPIDFAPRLAEILPYYDTYVLLAVVNALMHRLVIACSPRSASSRSFWPRPAVRPAGTRSIPAPGGCDLPGR